MLRYITKTIGLLCTSLIPALAIAATYQLPPAGNDIVGQDYVVQAKPGDTLASLGLRYGMSYHEMSEANPRVNPSGRLHGGQKILIPSEFILPPFRKGIVINLAELRMYYFPPDTGTVMTFPVAMGRDQWRTPTAATTVVNKEKDPIWNPPESIREYMASHGKMLPDRVYPGPDNPLGHYALYLGVSGYLIHGNNSASSIGKYVSSGCIRMNNTDVETLYSMVKIGTPVYIVHYPNKVGVKNGVIYQESQVPVDIPDAPSALNEVSLSEAVYQKLGMRTAWIDWKAASKVQKQHLGIPEPIGQVTGAATASADDPMPNVTPIVNTPTKSYNKAKRAEKHQVSFFDTDVNDNNVVIVTTDEVGMRP